MQTIVLQGEMFQEKELAHAYVKEMLHLPEYYGKNLDALYDCLTGFCDIEIIIIEKDSPYFQRVKRVFLAAAAENKNMTVKFI